MSQHIINASRSHRRRALAASGPALPTANLIQHLDATAITGLNDGDAVATWTATVGTNATQGTAAKRPLYKTGIQNSLPIVRADGTDDYLSLTGLTQASGSLTFITAIKSATGTSNPLFDTATGRLMIATLSNPANTVGWYDTGWKSIAAATTNFEILTWVLTSGGNGEVFRNGVSLGTAAYTARAIGGATTLLSRNDGLANLSADLGEFLIYSAALNAATRAQAETYLNNKWSVY